MYLEPICKKGKKMNQEKIFGKNDQKFPQFDVGHPFAYSRSSVNFPQNKSEDNNA